jgi:hypothetical protein
LKVLDSVDKCPGLNHATRTEFVDEATAFGDLAY